MGIITEYFDLQKKYEAQYGERTVVLMAIGVFYEIYEYDPTFCTDEQFMIDKDQKKWTEAVGHAIQLSTVLNCVLSYENTNEQYGINNPHKVGFPIISYEKNRSTLLANDYVIIRIDQQKNAGVKKVTRYVAEISSPTMQIDNILPTRATSNIACIYIEYQNGKQSLHKFDNFLITTGIAVVDIITGQNRVCEFYSKLEDQIFPIQELYRFLISHYPRELIIYIDDMPETLNKHSNDHPNPYVKYLERVLELRRFDRLTTKVNEVHPDYKKISYQIEFLNKIFTNKEQAQGNTSTRLNVIQKRNERIIEDFGIERMNYGRIAYILLMQHCYAHNTEIISRLSKPDFQWIDSNKHLILTHNAIIQLDIIGDNNKLLRNKRKAEIDSLMSVLDQNRTNLGRRLLYNLLQNPMLDSVDIQNYYNMVDEMLTEKISGESLWLVLDRHLKELPDIGRLQRKLEIKLITPKELALLYKSYIKIINIYVMILNCKAPTLHKHLFAKDDIDNFNSFLSRFTSIIDFNFLECCHIDSSESNSKFFEFTDCPINKNIYSDLDEKASILKTAETQLQIIVDHLNLFVTNNKTNFKGQKLSFKSAKRKPGATKQDPTGTILSTTLAKSNVLLAANVDTNICGVLQSVPYTTSARIITSDKISNLCSQIDNSKMWMRQKLLIIYESIIEEMSMKYTFYIAISNFISKIDLIHSYAKVSHTYNYHRPEIIETNSSVSFMEAQEIRHPIIERLNDGIYVANDIYLGNGENKRTDNTSNRTNGMLLYGVNQAGKSSLVKSIALNIIMAQSGCYTPSYLKYKPYSKIITRLSGSDNIFKGQSSFAVEMSELRTILRQSDSSTLVIGDELSRGTESNSATGITVSTILSLIDKGASFIFATHMHHIVDLPYISNLHSSKLRICHLSVLYHEESDDLIYDRKLQDGAGSSVYGLMVTRALGLPLDFINKANEIVQHMNGTNKHLLEPNTSHYNSNIYIDSCSLCGKNNSEIELHTHHLQEQQFADYRGLIGNMRKNAKDNLVVLCKNCHVKLHSEKKELVRVDISNGKLLILDNPTNIKH